ncbi:MAG: hypothetical protein K8R60_07540 [Burkholderiales bacterium]|nr:hypothetical protein [Burkholderiales bacterium]
MEPGKIRLINTGGDGAAGAMRIRIPRNFLWWTDVSVFDLTSGRSVDVYGASITVLALETLQLFGTYDTL